MVNKEAKILLRGLTASPGKVKGVAKVAYDPIEAKKKIKKGDIFITPMTSPDFMVTIMKSAGIITDFGGILCHAAIVAREMGIPCIVGAKNATSVIKDGEIISIDGESGIVYKDD